MTEHTQEHQDTMLDDAIAQAFVAARRKLDPAHHSRLLKAWELVAERAVHDHGDGSHSVKGQDQPEYLVDPEGCSCTDYSSGKAPEGLCKHILAVALEKRSRQKFQQLAEQAAQNHQPAPTPAACRVRSEFIQQIKGKQFVTFAGLLALAHESGLQALEARFVAVDSELATAVATATFADGRCFTESGDASPANVSKHIAPHFARMALTRAKARCLRDALNIGMASVEELAELSAEPGAQAAVSAKRAPFVPVLDAGMWREG